MHYNFYFDEVFHDKKITISSDGIINTFTEDKNDSYIGVFFGIKNNQRVPVLKNMCKLEQKYIQILDLKEEFKSTTFHRKNFNFGLRSFKKNTFNFYDEFFDILQDIKPIIHVNVLSKIEWLVRNIFDMRTIQQMKYVVSGSFYYSLTKFLIYYHTPQLIKSLYKSIEKKDPVIFQNELLNHFERVIDAIINIERKQRELPMLKDLYSIISSFTFDNEIYEKYDFIYFQNFDGLIKLLNELNISEKKVNIIIDNEEMTFQAASLYPFHTIKQVDSKNVIQIRISDHLCGFIGRMMYALLNDNSIKEDTISNIELIKKNNLIDKRLLSCEWFDIQLKHFQLYKKIYEVLIVQQEHYWATMTWSYSDQMVMFYSLLRYFSSFKSYSEFKKYSSQEHTEFYNSSCCNELEKHYSSFNKKYWHVS